MSARSAAVERMLASLRALSVGDAFGRHFEFQNDARTCGRELPPGIWRYSDDTAMALSVVEVLRARGEVDEDTLARAFADAYAREPWRGYGGGARRILEAIGRGGDFRELAPSLFPGGSFGNGAAMRVAPLGAYYAGDLERSAEQARRSARITHAHPEGVDGAVAVALAAANRRDDGAAQWLKALAWSVDAPKLRAGIEWAARLGPEDAAEAAEVLGTGYAVSAFDTVPYCLWVLAHHGDDFEGAMWLAAEAGGDADTTCAIIAGVLGAWGVAVPESWLGHTERLPEAFRA